MCAIWQILIVTFHKSQGAKDMVVGTVAAKAALAVALPQFELSRVRARVAREHPELTPEKLGELEMEYRQFLLMCRNEPNVAHQPSKELDWYWHAHILHT